MHRRVKKICAWMLILSVLLTGCQPMQPYYLKEDGDLSHFLDVATEIEYTDVCQDPLEEVKRAGTPRTLSNPQFDEFWDLTLEEAVHITLNNSKVLRSFGPVRQFGQIIAGTPERLSTSPSTIATVYDPAIQETGQSGVEQALATFDAIFSSTTTWDNTDREQNFSAGVVSQARIFQQDQVNINNEISKLSANGTQWFFRNVSIYSGSNNDVTRNTREVPSDWFTAFETEFRHPLLRNRGTQVNRIPVVLARIRTDNSLIDFETSVAEMLRSVEQAYWELYFFYHNLRAAKTGRDSAHAAWQKVEALMQSGSDGGEADKEAQAREQYFFFRDRVEQAQRDVFKSETQLRYLMGLTPTDHRLIRPADKPTAAKVEFDWNLVTEETMARNPLLRRQSWQIKSRELELIAARNQLLPQFDVIGLYRWLGQGSTWGSGVIGNDNGGPAGPPLFPPSAVDNLWDGNKQEYRLGFDFNMPLGFRREMSQVRSSQLALARARARFHDMELEVVHQLTDAFIDLDAAYQSVLTNFSRRVAAEDQVKSLEAAYQAGQVQVDLLLDAQRRQTDATISYYQALVVYNLSILAVHFRKGSIFEYDGVMLAEGPWPGKAYFDAANQARRRNASHYLDYGYSRPNVFGRGKVSDRWQGDSQLAPVEEAYYEPQPDAAADADAADDEDDTPTKPDDEDPFQDDPGDADLQRELDDAIDSMKDEFELPVPTEPDAPAEEPRQILPETDSDIDFDDLEASRRVRTAGQRRSRPKSTKRRADNIKIEWR